MEYLGNRNIRRFQFSHSVESDSFRPHESHHARPPCPSPTPWVHSNPCPSSQWCHPAISSSVIPFSSCPQSLSASKSFPMSQLFTWGGQSIGVSALASVLPMIIHDWFHSGIYFKEMIRQIWKSVIGCSLQCFFVIVKQNKTRKTQMINNWEMHKWAIGTSI